jgi:predicted kinase
MFPKATIICPDELIGYTKENPWTPKAARAAWSKSDKNLKEALQEVPLTVFDATFVSVKKRKKYINLAKKNDVLPMIIYCVASVDTALVRNASREKSRQVPGFVMKRMFNTFEAPTAEEGFEVVLSFNSETNEARVVEGKVPTTLFEELKINL